jgi:hypothetical protein
MFRDVESALHSDALAIQRARVRVSAAIGPIDVGVADEAASVVLDFDAATFTTAVGAARAFGGTFQVVLRATAAGELRWGFDDSALAAAATRPLRAAVRSDAALFEASLSSPIPIPEGRALAFATLVALRSGFTGAAVVGGSLGRLLVALDLHPRDGRAGDRWCAACGGPGPYVVEDPVTFCRSCAGDLRELGEPHPFDPSRVVFEGTFRTPLDVLTLRAAFGSAPNLALTAPGFEAEPGALCLFCGAARDELIVLNDAFAVCPPCAHALANRDDPS